MNGEAHKDVATASKGGTPSLRTCAVTRAEQSPDDLIRFVVDPDGAIVVDVARRLPGRGVWVGCSRALVAQAVSGKAFAQSLRRKVKVAADLADIVEALLVRRVREALSLANKAGLVICGFAQVDAAIVKGEPVALVHASGAAADGADKLDRRFRAVCRELDRPPVIVNEMAGEQLSLAIGRPNVIHAALKGGGATAGFLREAGRLSRYRSGTTGSNSIVVGLKGPVDTSQDAGNA